MNTFFLRYCMSGLQSWLKAREEVVDLNYLFLCLVALSITGILCLTILAIFCYKQDNMKMLFESKTTVKADSILSDLTVNIDKQKKENSKTLL